MTTASRSIYPSNNNVVAEYDSTAIDNSSLLDESESGGVDHHCVYPEAKQLPRYRIGTVLSFLIEADWEEYGGRESWERRWSRRRNNNDSTPKVLIFNPDNAERGPTTVPLGFKVDCCNKPRRGRGDCPEGHRIAIRRSCSHSWHDGCLPRRLLKLKVGALEACNPGFPHVWMALGDASLSVWVYESAPMAITELKGERNLVTKRQERWIKSQVAQGNKIHFRGERLSRENSGTYIVRRFFLASDRTSAGIRPRETAPKRIFLGAPDTAIRYFIDLTGGAWMDDPCTEPEAQLLATSLGGMHRVEAVGELRDALDKEELMRPCPIKGCGEKLKVVGWVTPDYKLIMGPNGKYATYRQNAGVDQ